MKLQRFIDAQNGLHEITYDTAMQEVRRGRRRSRWLPFITPKLKTMDDDSEMGRIYGLVDVEEAKAFMHHPVLGRHLKNIVHELLMINGVTIMDIIGSPYDRELHASLTLFDFISKINNNSNSIFARAIDRFYSGTLHEPTLQKLGPVWRYQQSSESEAWDY